MLDREATVPAASPAPPPGVRDLLAALDVGDRSATTFTVLDPASEEPIATVAAGGVVEATAAVDAASAALPDWSGAAPRTRADVLRRAYDAMLAEADNLAGLIACENGKAVSDARGEVAYAADFFRWFAEEAVRSEGAYGVAPAGGTRTIVTHRPVGVAALVTPWNFPAAMITRKVAPALAAGCTVVIKPAAETPLTALALAQLLAAAGVPDGVVTVLPTDSAAAVATTWLEDPRVRKISFTGSTGVGRVLLRQAAERVVNSSMELGGNAPFVVTDDADLEAAVAGAMLAKFRNGGQACTAANRFYVHARVADEFARRLGAATTALRVGPGLAETTDIGPMVSAKAREDVRARVKRAVAEGARIVAQAPIPEGPGFYVAPMVLTDVGPDASILEEEIFGPVAPIVTWDDESALLEQVNRSEYGLAAYVYAGELGGAVRLAERLEAGMVGINCGLVSDPAAPFGGVKQSGLGREGAREGLREFQETQYLSVAWD